MKQPYPACEPYAVHHIRVDAGHELYVEECGNPEGIPAVFLHGGPGSGCNPDHRRYFDPACYRIVLFDQRGSGKSLPLGETGHNRTADLVADMETIRRHLTIDRWLLFGGSWGATLSLIYLLTHPGNSLGLILRGTFLARESDLEWFFLGLRRLFPREWERFTQAIRNASTLDTLIDGYYEAVRDPDAKVALEAARRWSEWGDTVVSWHKRAKTRKRDTAARQERMLAKVRIETHFARHRYFIDENEILARLGELPELPVAIVHGRFDLTCTEEAAWLLHRALPGSRFVQVAKAGHLIDEPAMTAALIQETDRLCQLLRGG